MTRLDTHTNTYTMKYVYVYRADSMSGEQPLSNLNATTVCALASFAKSNGLGNSPDSYCCTLWRLSVGLMGLSVIENLNLNLALHKECCKATVASAAIHLHSFVVDKVNSVQTLLPLLGLCLYLCLSTDSKHTQTCNCVRAITNSHFIVGKLIKIPDAFYSMHMCLCLYICMYVCM